MICPICHQSMDQLCGVTYLKIAGTIAAAVALIWWLYI